MSRYIPAPGDRVQLWYFLRDLYPFHGRCGVARVVGRGLLNVLVQLDDGPAVVVPYGHLRPPQDPPPQLSLL